LGWQFGLVVTHRSRSMYQ